MMTKGQLRRLDENLWVAEQPLRYGVLQVGARMTLVRLPSGGLWVHSPIRPTPELLQQVRALGPVRFLVAPNRYHHLFLGAWAEAHPDARTYAAPGLAEKRKELRFDTVLADGAPPEWEGVLEARAWRGAPLLNEVAFLHRPSRTLVLTDAVHNVGPEAPALTRAAFRVLGGHGRMSTWAVDRVVNRDRKAARESLEALLRWDFGRVVLAHGRVAENAGPEALRAAYHWL